MSNYPDNFRGTNLDFNPAANCPEAYKQVIGDQQVYVECLKAITSIFIKHKRPALGRDMSAIMEGIAELLYGQSEREIEQLAERGCDLTSYPDGHEKMCADAAEQIADSIRLQPVNYSEALLNALDHITTSPVQKARVMAALPQTDAR